MIDALLRLSLARRWVVLFLVIVAAAAAEPEEEEAGPFSPETH